MHGLVEALGAALFETGLVFTLDSCVEAVDPVVG
jgi:hypothetical protein